MGTYDVYQQAAGFPQVRREKEEGLLEILKKKKTPHIWRKHQPRPPRSSPNFSKINKKKTTPRHTIIKRPKAQDKMKIRKKRKS